MDGVLCELLCGGLLWCIWNYVVHSVGRNRTASVAVEIRLFTTVMVTGLKKMSCESGTTVSIVVSVASMTGWKWCIAVLMTVLKWSVLLVTLRLTRLIRTIEPCTTTLVSVTAFSTVMKLNGCFSSSRKVIMLTTLSGVAS